MKSLGNCRPLALFRSPKYKHQFYQSVPSHGHLPLGLIQPGLEHFQGWDTHSPLGQRVPLPISTIRFITTLILAFSRLNLGISPKGAELPPARRPGKNSQMEGLHKHSWARMRNPESFQRPERGTEHHPNETHAPQAGILCRLFNGARIFNKRHPSQKGRGQPERSGETSRAGELGLGPGDRRPGPGPEQPAPAPPPPAHLCRAQPPARAPRRPAPAALLAGCDPCTRCHWASQSHFRLFIGQWLCPYAQRNWE